MEHLGDIKDIETAARVSVNFSFDWTSVITFICHIEAGIDAITNRVQISLMDIEDMSDVKTGKCPLFLEHSVIYFDLLPRDLDIAVDLLTEFA